MKERQPKLVSSNQRRPPNLTRLQRQTVTIRNPMIQRSLLGSTQLEQDTAPGRMRYTPILLQKMFLIALTPPPLNLLPQLTQPIHPTTIPDPSQNPSNRHPTLNP
jgi:hypothetical protein